MSRVYYNCHLNCACTYDFGSAYVNLVDWSLVQEMVDFLVDIWYDEGLYDQMAN